MADSKSKPEISVSSKEIAKGSEEVLIEIDGKFELVSAADMQANQPTDPKHSEASTAHGHKEEKMGGKKEVNSDDAENYDDDFEDDVPSTGSSPIVEKTALQHSPQSKKETSNEQTEQHFSRKPTASEEPSTAEKTMINRSTAVPKKKTSIQERPNSGSKSSPSTKEVAKVQDAPSRDIIPVKSDAFAESQTELEQHRSVEIIVSEHNSESTNKSNATTGRSRTKSAPESRSTLSQFWEDDEMERKQRCESAFRAWLVKKDAQIAEERKLQRANTRVLTREDVLQKIEQSETAYKAWLENKNRQVQERRHHQRTIKSASTGNSKESQAQQSAAAFRSWLEQKQVQRQQEKEVHVRRVKEEAELARTVDPSLANHAYRR